MQIPSKVEVEDSSLKVAAKKLNTLVGKVARISMSQTDTGNPLLEVLLAVTDCGIRTLSIAIDLSDRYEESEDKDDPETWLPENPKSMYRTITKELNCALRGQEEVCFIDNFAVIPFGASEHDMAYSARLPVLITIDCANQNLDANAHADACLGYLLMLCRLMELDPLRRLWAHEDCPSCKKTAPPARRPN